MKQRYSEQQIVYALKQAELVERIADICRKMGIGEATFYNWRKKYAGLGVSEVRRLRARAGEPPAQGAGGGLVPGQADSAGRTLKKGLKPARKRELARGVPEDYGVSERHACGLIQLQRSTFRYGPRGRDDTVLRMRIKELAKTYIRYGYKRIHTLLLREGFEVNHKRLYRMYCEEGLGLRIKRKRKRASHTRVPLPAPVSGADRAGPIHARSAGYCSGLFLDGRTGRSLP